MTPKAVIDSLAYACYRHNRQLFPRISPERWRLVFDGADVMEKRYQDEIDQPPMEETLTAFGEGWYRELGHAQAHGQEIPVMVTREG